MRHANHREAPRDDGVIELGAAPGFPIVVEIAVHRGPISGIVASPDGTRLMVANYGHDSVSVIDTDTCRVVHTVPGLTEPFTLAMASRDTDHAYVSIVSSAYDSIAVIDVPTNTVIAAHPLALSVSDLAVSPDGGRVYASRNGSGGADVAVLDTATGRVEGIALETRRGASAECVRVSPDGNRVYVATNGPTGGQLVVIGTQAESRGRRKGSPGGRRAGGCGVMGTVEIGLPIRDVALSPSGAIAHVASSAPDGGAVIHVVDTRTAKITGTRKIGEISGVVTGLTLSGDGDRAYLVSDDCVTVLSTLTHDVVGALRVTNQPSCVVESPDARYLYVADYSGKVTVAPVASIVTLGTETAVRESETPAEWVVPEPPRYEPASA